MMAFIGYNNKYKNNNNSVIFLFSLLCFATLIPKLFANIADFDPYLEKRAEEALKSSLAAYNEHPEDLTQNFYREVGETLLNGTRRHLKEEKKNDKAIKDDKDDDDNGECKANNPIDQCWRCNKNWADNRKALADCAKGFGHGTTGGKDGRFYVVTDPSDDNVEEPVPGTLRHAVIQDEPLWIIFEKSMIIRLKQELMINSDKTIDGRGVSVHIAYGAGLTLQFVHNVIIHNIRVHHILSMSGGMIRDSIHHIGLRTTSDGDAISLFGANRIWIDHCTLTKGADGLIDAIMASTAITISNCKFNHHNDVMLLGANDAFPQDKIMQVTIAFNRFGKGCIQRMPRCRWGFFHVVNNDYARWEMYAIGGTANPTIISQGNRFKADDNPNTKEVTNRNGAPEALWRNWQWRSEGDLFKNGAFFRESGPDIKRTPFTEHTSIPFLPAKFVGRLTRKAGVIKCKIGREC